MDEPAQTAALVHLQLTDLWEISGRVEKRLQAIGIATLLQLRDSDAKWIRSHSSVVMERMVLELQGVPCIVFEDEKPDRKSITASRSFGRPVDTHAEMQEAVAT